MGAPLGRVRRRGVPEVSVPLMRLLDRQPCVPPSVQSATEIRRDDAVTLEDARREARTDTTGAIHDEHSLVRYLADALLELLIRDVSRAGHMTFDILGSFADVQKRRALVREPPCGPRIELLRRRGRMARCGDRLRVSAHVVEANERELRPQSFRLLFVAREEHERRPVPDDGATSHGEAVVPNDVERATAMGRAVEMRND